MEPIASSSSSTLPSLLPAREYEVFLSFRGLDVRNNFSDHLYASLSRSKIRAFRDEEELPKGEEISPSLIRAIGESKIYIPIFSENYASSKWCLQELAQMVECCKREKGHLFLPIFYLVDPRDVRHQQGPYEQAFEQHAQKHSQQTVQGWKEALQVVGKMKGWHVTESNGQGFVINEVLSKIELHFRRIYTLVTDELVGIHTHVEEVVKLLNLGSNNPKVVGIHGMGGIGKTTLSKAVYNKISAEFDRCCFLEGVKETLTRNDGVISLQNKIISGILRQDYQVENMSEGINVIKERVCKHKLILVLDDVDDKFEFDKVLGKLRDFSLESRFIFTTRNKRVLDFFIGCKIYEVREMSPQYSLKLFSKHAFRTDHPPEDDSVITQEFVKVAAGLPLALKVMGSLLFHRERRLWEEKLKEFKGILSPESEVSKIMKISYDELTPTEKQIFLDIACLFIGSKKEVLYNMWNACSFHPESGINTLVDRSLMKLDEDNRFWMHDHIRDLGRAIVQEEDIRHPHRRSRIWCEEDAMMDLLRNNEANNWVEVLMVDMRRWKNEVLTENEFKKLHWLRYLEVRNGSLTGDFSKILPNLCMLRLYDCDLIPANLNMKKLVVLDLESCGVEDNWRGWKEMQLAQKLAVIYLRHCRKLTRAPDLSQCVSLESINIDGCSAMKGALHIGNFKNLKTLKLVGTQITELTGDFRMLQQLEEIDARRTDLRELPARIDRLSSLKTLNLASEDEVTPRSMKVGRLPTSLKRLSISSRGQIPNLLELKELESLSFFRCHHLRIPEDIGELVNLKELIVWRSPLDALFPLKALPSSLTTLAVVDCGKLWRLPSLANLNKLTALNLKQLGAWEIRGLGELRALKTMEITDAPNLNKLDGLETLFHLTHLKLEGCGSLEKLPSLANLIKLQRLEIVNCGQLKDKVTGLERLVSLEHLSLEGCTSIRKLPRDMSKLRKLEHLNVRRCTKLMEATGIEGLESLRLLDMSGCSSITKLGDLSGLKNLVELHTKGCTKLTLVTGIDRLETLRALKMSGCRSIKQLGDLSGLENLHTLDISGCIELTEVKGIERLPSLEYLWMSDCRSIKELGNLSGLKKLRQFHIEGCTELTEVKGLERLQSLEYLWMSDCRSIKELGDLSRMKKLREFDIRGCTQLAQVKGLEEMKWPWDLRMDKRLKVKYLWERYGEQQVNRFVRFAHEKHLRRRHSRNGAQPLSPGKT
ncbi:unnamed protein product [Linum trigynum]|uniref:TIR domain-containing protein n=1 Tax=Linum trigynum TaxID=586398 RepID=A0AAV2FIH6_9ROSI